jgi:hypothetical protein
MKWREAVDVGRKVCKRMQAKGYHGPVGIDAMRYRDESGTTKLRLIQEINARWTMGRLAAAWRRYLPPNVEAQWTMNSTRDEGRASGISQCLATSPHLLDGRPLNRRMKLRWI